MYTGLSEKEGKDNGTDNDGSKGALPCEQQLRPVQGIEGQEEEALASGVLHADVDTLCAVCHTGEYLR